MLSAFSNFAVSLGKEQTNPNYICRLPSFVKIDALNNFHDVDEYDNLDEEHLYHSFFRSRSEQGEGKCG